MIELHAFRRLASSYWNQYDQGRERHVSRGMGSLAKSGLIHLFQHFKPPSFSNFSQDPSIHVKWVWIKRAWKNLWNLSFVLLKEHVLVGHALKPIRACVSCKSHHTRFWNANLALGFRELCTSDAILIKKRPAIGSSIIHHHQGLGQVHGDYIYNSIIIHYIHIYIYISQH